MTVLEHIKELSASLSEEEKHALAAYLTSLDRLPHRKPRDLYGIWKDGFPSDFDVDSALREIRGEWQKEVQKIAP
jgi:hypothetical protein